MLTHHALLSQNAIKAAAASGTVSAVQTLTNRTIEVGAELYTFIAVLLGLAGVYLARLVTIGDENRRLGRTQTYRETGPLTWIGVLIVCPFIWHFDIAIPWASMIGLGVGYSVKLVLKIFGSGAVDVARALAKRAADALGEADEDLAPPPPSPPALLPETVAPPLDAPGARRPAVILPPMDKPADQQGLIDRLGDVPDTLPPAAKPG